MGKKSKRQRPGKAKGRPRGDIPDVQPFRHSFESLQERYESFRKANPTSIRAILNLQKKEFTRATTENYNSLPPAFRYVPLHSFCNFLLDECQQNANSVTKEDLQFLEEACNSKTSVQQAWAYWGRGVLSHHIMGVEVGIRYIHKAMQVCETATNEERQEIFDPLNRGDQVLDKIHNLSQQHLSIWKNGRAGADANETPRAKADFHMMMYNEITEDSTAYREARFEQLQFFGELLTNASNEDVDFVTKEDRRFLKTVSKSTTELSISQAYAYAMRALTCSFHAEIDNAVQCAQKAIQVCKKAREERQEYGVSKLEVVHARCQGSISQWRSYRLISVDPETGTETPVTASLFGGEECEGCGKTIEELGVAMLDCCSACQLTYYCSKECQASHWKTHKHKCRKPGEFKPGDTAFHPSFEPTTPKSDLALVRVLAPAEDADQHWIVSTKQNSTDITCKVGTKYLRCCRPALWNYQFPGNPELKVEVVEPSTDPELSVEVMEPSTDLGGDDILSID